MICTHCGICCIDYLVIVIKPEYICETIEEFNNLTEEAFMGKKDFQPCPHLTWEHGLSRCAIHDYDWYKLTPCYEFTQTEDSNCICRLGEWVGKYRPGYYEQYCKHIKESYLSVDELRAKIGNMIMEIKNDTRSKDKRT